MDNKPFEQLGQKSLGLSKTLQKPRTSTIPSYSELVSATRKKTEPSEAFSSFSKRMSPSEEASVRQPTQRFGEVPELNWWDKWKEIGSRPSQLVPFLASGVEAVKFAKLIGAANRLDKSKETDDDLKLLKDYVDTATADRSFGYKVWNVLSMMPSFAGELLTTSGVASAARVATTTGAKKMLKNLVTKKGKAYLDKKIVKSGIRWGSAIAARTAQTPVAGITGIPAGALEKQLNSKLRHITTDEDVESISLSSLKSVGERWIENLSEFSGGLLTSLKLSKPIKNKLLETALFASFQKVNQKVSPSALVKVVKKIGWNGVLGEMFEEQMASVGHGVLYSVGLGDQKLKFPSAEDLAVQFVAFSVPGVAISALERYSRDLKNVKGEDPWKKQTKTDIEKMNKAIKDANDPKFKMKEEGIISDELGDDVEFKEFKGLEDLTLKTVEKLKGKTMVNKQFISDLTNAPDLKQAERELVRKILGEMPEGKVNVKEFADKVSLELLPLKRRGEIGEPKTTITKYEGTTLPKELRGDVYNYSEHIYESPIKTSAGNIHYSGENFKNYFAHTRIEDMADGKTRRVIEAQSDLFQKGGLKEESGPWGVLKGGESVVTIDDQELARRLKIREKETAKLQPHKNIWHERMIKEEIKSAGQDGKSILQFPTGETAMKIEGLGQTTNFSIARSEEPLEGLRNLNINDLKSGVNIFDSVSNKWIITDVLGDGKFKVVPAEIPYGLPLKRWKKEYPNSFIAAQEQFDISGKIDTSNPIYRFYEKDIQKYLKRIHPEMERITDKQGVEWFQVQIRAEEAKAPVEAFMLDRSDQKDITGEEAMKRTSEVINRLKLSGVDMQVAKTILTEDKKQAMASSFGTNITFIKLVSEFAGQHELGHTIFRNLDILKLFKDKGITRQGLLAELREKYPNKNNAKLEEILMEDLELHLKLKQENKPSTFTGKIKEFFDTVWEWLKQFGSNENISQIRKFYETIEKGKATETTAIKATGTEKFITGKEVVDFSKIKDIPVKFKKKEVVEKPKPDMEEKIKPEGQAEMELIDAGYKDTNLLAQIEKKEPVTKAIPDELTTKIKKIKSIKLTEKEERILKLVNGDIEKLAFNVIEGDSISVNMDFERIESNLLKPKKITDKIKKAIDVFIDEYSDSNKRAFEIMSNINLSKDNKIAKQQIIDFINKKEVKPIIKEAVDKPIIKTVKKPLKAPETIKQEEEIETKSIIEFETKFRDFKKPETVSSVDWKKIKDKNKTAFIKYSKEAKKFSTPKEFINDYLSKLKYEWNIKKTLKAEGLFEKSKTPYYDFFNDSYSKGIEIIRRDWDKSITPAKVKKAMILTVGRNFEDGFSGITIKAVSYLDEYAVRIDDGEFGNVLNKTYNHFPLKEELELDSLLLNFPNRLTISDIYPEIIEPTVKTKPQIPTKPISKSVKPSATKAIPAELAVEAMKRPKETSEIAAKKFRETWAKTYGKIPDKVKTKTALDIRKEGVRAENKYREWLKNQPEAVKEVKKIQEQYNSIKDEIAKKKFIRNAKHELDTKYSKIYAKTLETVPTKADPLSRPSKLTVEKQIVLTTDFDIKDTKSENHKKAEEKAFEKQTLKYEKLMKGIKPKIDKAKKSNIKELVETLKKVEKQKKLLKDIEKHKDKLIKPSNIKVGDSITIANNRLLFDGVVESVKKDKNRLSIKLDSQKKSIRININDISLVIFREKSKLPAFTVANNKSLFDKVVKIIKKDKGKDKTSIVFSEGKSKLPVTLKGLKLKEEPKIITKAEDILLKDNIRAQARSARKVAAQTRKETRMKLLFDIENKKISRDQAQKRIKEYAKDLPFEIRGRLLNKMKNAKDIIQVETTVAPFIRKITENYLRKKTIKDIDKIFDKVKYTKQSGRRSDKRYDDTQKLLQRLGEYSKISKKDADAIIEQNLKTYADKTMPSKVVAENRMLRIASGIKDMSLTELIALKNILTYMNEKSLMIGSLRKVNRQELEKSWFNKGVDVITGNEGLAKGIETVDVKYKYDDIPTGFTNIVNFMKTKEGRRRMKEATFNKIITFFKSMISFPTVLDILSSNDKSSKAGESWLSRMANFVKAESNYKAGLAVENEKLKKMYEKAYGKKTNRELNEKMAKDNEIISLGLFEVDTSSGKKEMIDFKFSKAEARYMWMVMKDPALDKTFRKGMYYTQDMINAIDSFLSNPDKVFAEEQLKWYKEYYKRINKVYKELRGVDLPFNEFYIRIRRGDISKEGMNTFDEDLHFYKQLNSKSFIERKSNIKRIKQMNDITVAQTHIAEMEHFIAYGVQLRNVNLVFGNADVRAAIVQEFDKGMLELVDNFMEAISKTGKENAFLLNNWEKARSRFVTGVLAARPTIGVKQLISFIAFGDSIPLKNFFSGVYDFWKNPIENYRFLKKHSKFFKHRGDNIERDVRTASQSDANSAFRNKPNWINLLLLNIKLGDKAAILVGGWSVYKYHYKKAIAAGKSEAKAIEFGIDKFELASTVQQSAAIADQSKLQRGTPIEKTFTMFLSSPNLYFQKVLGATRNLVAGRMDKKQAAKIFVIYWLIIPMLFQFISDFGRWDEDEQRRAMILGPLNGIFIVGDGINLIIRASLGMKAFDQNIFYQSMFSDIVKAAKSTKDIVEKPSMEEVLEAIRDISRISGEVTGLPLKYAHDLTSGVADTFKGDYVRGLGKMAGWSDYAVSEKEKSVKRGRIEKELEEKRKAYKKVNIDNLRDL